MVSVFRDSLPFGNLLALFSRNSKVTFGASFPIMSESPAKTLRAITLSLLRSNACRKVAKVYIKIRV